MAEINVRRAAEADIDTLVGLWKESFHDPEDYIRLFYKRNFERMETWLLEWEGKPASMSNLLPATVVDGKREQKAWLGYAGCVRKKFRSHGLWRVFQEKLTEHLAEQDAVLFFKPAAGLASYYEKIGFSVDSRWSILPITPKEELKEAAFMPLCAEEYARFRENAFSGHPFVRWDVRHLSWAIEDCIYFGGHAEKVRYDGREYAMLSLHKGDEVIIQETTMPKELLEDIAWTVMTHYQTKKLTLYTNYCGEQWPYIISSMSKGNRIADPYVNVMLI